MRDASFVRRTLDPTAVGCICCESRRASNRIAVRTVEETRMRFSRQRFYAIFCCGTRGAAESVIPSFAKEGWTRPKEKCCEASFDRSGRGSSMKGVVKTNIPPQTGEMEVNCHWRPALSPIPSQFFVGREGPPK